MDGFKQRRILHHGPLTIANILYMTFFLYNYFTHCNFVSIDMALHAFAFNFFFNTFLLLNLKKRDYSRNDYFKLIYIKLMKTK